MCSRALRGESSNARDDVWSLGIGVRDGDRSSPLRRADAVSGLPRACCRTRRSTCRRASPRNWQRVIKRCGQAAAERRYAQAGEVRRARSRAVERCWPATGDRSHAPSGPCGARVLACSRPSRRDRAAAGQESSPAPRSPIASSRSRRLPLPSATGCWSATSLIRPAIRGFRSIAQYGALGCPDAVALRQRGAVIAHPPKPSPHGTSRPPRARMKPWRVKSPMREGFRLYLAPAITSAGGTASPLPRRPR